MSGWRTRIVSSAAGISLLVAELVVGGTRGASSTRLQGEALAAAEADARTAAAPLADGKVDVDRTQVFEVSEGATRVRVVPVRYSPRVPGELRNVDYCALVIAVTNRPTTTVQTIGTGYTETVGCTGLDGIGFSDVNGDGSFDIALIYSTLAPPDRTGKTPVVVRHDATGSFTVDEALGSALDAQGGITTLARLRTAAARLTRTPAR